MEENSYQQKVALPNATVVLVLGIVSIVGCCCYGILGIVCGIIALVLAGSSEKLYRENPELYTIGSYKNLGAGKICAIIGLVLSVFYIAWCVWLFTSLGVDALTNPELMQERMMELFGQ
ncbi:DUF4190 domain-containing protein [Bacteroidales bacterium OttesenSCG-928-A17]|nr:DUF4190 domain-containing protein [Bacteroidales bacterium OttesenSCG-928-A17]